MHDLGQHIAADPSLPPLERINATIDALIEWAEGYREGFRTLIEGSGGTEVQSIVAAERARQVDLVLRALEEMTGAAAATPEARYAVEGWVESVLPGIARWLERRDLTARQLRELFVGVLIGALAAVDELDRGGDGATTVPGRPVG